MFNGIVNLYKERDFTSLDAVAKSRGIFGQKKIGHTGTLDPLAEGVLILCLGKATKLADIIVSKEKEYRCTMLLGMETDTEDVTGKVLKEADMSQVTSLSEDHIREVISSFIGEQSQVPPIYSALKINGRKLYDYARSGETVEIPARDITVYDIKIDKIMLPQVEFVVRCSKGTYIRSLCRDMGRKLGVGGVMKSLIREEVNGFFSKDAYTLDQLSLLKENGELEKAILPIDALLKNYPVASIKPEGDKYLSNGNKIYLNQLSYNEKDKDRIKNAEFVRINRNGELFALYKYDKEDNILRNFKMLGE
ncbi:MAG: tRNA pseudouridine(55) synthase TruB [Eubacterium sp.]|nr:tRNA pseudouridine(55) synthase TruB [Eubacterium sp.]